MRTNRKRDDVRRPSLKRSTAGDEGILTPATGVEMIIEEGAAISADERSSAGKVKNELGWDSALLVMLVPVAGSPRREPWPRAAAAASAPLHSRCCAHSARKALPRRSRICVRSAAASVRNRGWELRGVHSFFSSRALSLTSMFALLQQASAMEAELRAAKDKVDLAQAKKVCLGF